MRLNEALYCKSLGALQLRNRGGCVSTLELATIQHAVMKSESSVQPHPKESSLSWSNHKNVHCMHTSIDYTTCGAA